MLAIESGAVPVTSVELIWPVAEIVVAATVFGVVAPTVPFRGPENCVLAVMVVPVIAEGVVPPIAPGAAIVAPLRDDALRFGIFVVEATVSGGVPVTTVL